MSGEASPNAQSQPPAPSQPPVERYIFSGHAIGAAARFHKLDEQEHHHVVPVLGASVLPPTGGLSTSEVSNYSFEVTHPRRRNLLTVHRITTRAEGTVTGTQFRTETEATIESITIVDKLHIDFLRFHMVATRATLNAPAELSTEGNKIVGIHLGGATVRVELDDDMLRSCGTKTLIGKYLERNPDKFKRNGELIQFDMVRQLQLSGLDRESEKIEQVARNAVKWNNFGTIHFGEVIVKNDDRQVTLVRLEMGSDAGGSGTVGDGHSNGSSGSN